MRDETSARLGNSAVPICGCGCVTLVTEYGGTCTFVVCTVGGMVVQGAAAVAPQMVGAVPWGTMGALRHRGGQVGR